MEKELFEKRVNDVLNEVVNEIRYQIERNDIHDLCDEKYGKFADVKAVIYAALKDSADKCIGKPCMPNNKKRFDLIRRNFRWFFFH